MDERIKTLWTGALRSGEFTQTSKKLKRADGHCCLGVLCELYLRENPDKGEWRFSVLGVGTNFTFQPASPGSIPEQSILPQEVQIWAGLDSVNPRILDNAYASLTEHNDGRRSMYGEVILAPKTFGEIAQLIEEYL